MRAKGIAIALTLLQGAAAQAAPAPPPMVGQVLADRLDVGFRACSLQLVRHDYLTQKNEAALKKEGIALGAPPPDVQQMAARLFGADGIYASVEAPEGRVWIAASTTVPACKVTLADTSVGLTARMRWTDRLRSTPGWNYDAAKSGMSGQLMREFLTLNPDRPGGHLVVFVGPNTIFNGGNGIQMIMTVALEARKAS